LVAFTKSFQKNNVKITSTGETADFLKEINIDVTPVSSLTN